MAPPQEQDVVSLADEKDEKEEQVETVEGISGNLNQKYYHAESAEEKHLDKKINLKLDFIVISVLAINFLVKHHHIPYPSDSPR